MWRRFCRLQGRRWQIGFINRDRDIVAVRECILVANTIAMRSPVCEREFGASTSIRIHIRLVIRATFPGYPRDTRESSGCALSGFFVEPLKQSFHRPLRKSCIVSREDTPGATILFIAVFRACLALFSPFFTSDCGARGICACERRFASLVTRSALLSSETIRGNLRAGVHADG